MKTISAPAHPPGAEEQTSTFQTDDGIALFYRWRNPSPGTERCVILLHRGHEHSGRLAEASRALCGEGAAGFAYDARGHGRSPGRRGDAPDAATLVRDLDAFVRHVRMRHGFSEDQIVVVANSVAGVVASAWVHDYAPRIRGLVLVAPAFSIKLYVPLALPGLRAALRFKKDLFIKSYVRPAFLTRDHAEARRYALDRLITRDISARVLVGLHDLARRAIDDAGVIDTPTLVLSAGADCVVRESRQRVFYERLASPRKRFIRHAGMRHAMLHERERAAVFADIRKFIDDVFCAPQPDDEPLLSADRDGPTAREFAQLQSPTAPVRRASFAIQRLALQTAGRLSEGIRIGWQHGFDSGRSLDYIYQNRPAGHGWIGRQIDRIYLQAPGWRGIRQRRGLLESALRKCLLEAGGQPVHVVDLAAGAGRYVLAVLPDFPNASTLLSDWCDGNLRQAKSAAEAIGLDRVRFEQGDAFDTARLASLIPKADVVIVSGLYELFPTNAKVRQSLRGIASLLKPGGCLIYTNQPTHPQLETIARVLRNRDGEPWIMRRRSQAEMDALARSVGLHKERTLVDDQGIFTVSIARKETAK